jgi:uncharacterized protein YajQ (UPF0234 family)
MKIMLMACIATIVLANNSKNIIVEKPIVNNQVITDAPVVQVAVLLDVSGSMDGLLEQAKTQLWSMVETLGKASCNGAKPKIEIALYEYGRPTNGVANNYIKQISPFTTDLDQLSAQLFQLKTDGGDEYCGAVMVKSLQELTWSDNPAYYKVIFIAGNESFRQGGVSVNEACKLAKEKGVIINTIYCGENQAGIGEYWNMRGECGNGIYSNIDQNSKEQYIAAPQDSMIFVLNNKLNGSYVPYNWQGDSKAKLQKRMDTENTSASRGGGLKRAAVKASASYSNSGWDLVDAYKADSTVLKRVDKKYLPAEVKDKSDDEVKKYVEVKQAERGAIQQQMNTLVADREKHVAKVRSENARNAAGAAQNLDNAIQSTIKTQAAKYNFVFGN